MPESKNKLADHHTRCYLFISNLSDWIKNVTRPRNITIILTIHSLVLDLNLHHQVVSIRCSDMRSSQQARFSIRTVINVIPPVSRFTSALALATAVVERLQYIRHYELIFNKDLVFKKYQVIISVLHYKVKADRPRSAPEVLAVIHFLFLWLRYVVFYHLPACIAHRSIYSK